MRFTLVIVCLLAIAVAVGQTPAAPSLFATTKIEAAVVVTPNKAGMQDVAITILKPTYSHELLQAQIARLGKELGFEPRGLQVTNYSFDPSDETARQVRATFGIAGLIDPQAGVLHVQPLAKALSIAQAPDSLEAVMIEFQGQSPTPNTIKSCSPPAPGCSGVELEGRSEGAGAGIEYRVKFLTHDPDKVSVPDRPQQPVREVETKPEPKGTDWTLMSLIGLAAIAVGALVYSLLLRGRPAPRA